jgi:hypothetical protein
MIILNWAAPIIVLALLPFVVGYLGERWLHQRRIKKERHE